MLTLEMRESHGARCWTAIIAGPKGRIKICDLGWVDDSESLLTMYYWDAWGVLQGNYHCCLSVPGKVSLL